MITKFKLFESNEIDIYDLISKNDINGVKKYIADGGDIEARTEYGTSALIISANRDKTIILKLLIDAGADLNTQDNIGQTAMMYSKLNIIKILIDAGADWDIKEERDKTFFDYLSHENQQKIVDLYPEKYRQYLIKEKGTEFNL